ncbi:hypothetical protein M514_12617 [Trichuris suis]|uniref:FLYWCH-type domain-containing protein n=1 Tax=Trichuris suis TaxID=68888 RepID=A0A085MV82_9BILA|nr:hypothetical protein M514_12617 [Trichuris suis]
MEETCEVVVSQKGFHKLRVRGYLMVKEKCAGERYYWCCDHRKSLYCGGRAISCFRNGQHVLQKFVDHNHAPVASAPYVATIVEEIKTRARSTADLPCQIVHSCTTSAPPNVAPYLPSRAALSESIRRVRRAERPREPRSLAEVAIPEELQRTLTGEPFLISDLAVEDHRMLIFASKADIEKLSAASLWIMDGTFKTVPRLFYQLYTIHGALQTSRFSIFPLVYILMTGKSEELYRRVFQELGDFGERNELHLRPSVIMTDLELSAINAARTEFPDAMNKACFFHSSQCVWRKIQSCGLASTYADDEDSCTVYVIRIMQNKLFERTAAVSSNLEPSSLGPPRQSDGGASAQPTEHGGDTTTNE